MEFEAAELTEFFIFSLEKIHFLFTSNLFSNKIWIQSDRFWYDFSVAIIDSYKIPELLKKFEKKYKKILIVLFFHLKIIFI